MAPTFPEVRLGSKAQIVLPREARQTLGLKLVNSLTQPVAVDVEIETFPIRAVFATLSFHRRNPSGHRCHHVPVA